MLKRFVRLAALATLIAAAAATVVPACYAAADTCSVWLGPQVDGTYWRECFGTDASGHQYKYCQSLSADHKTITNVACK
jgi:hypothetical protein